MGALAAALALLTITVQGQDKFKKRDLKDRVEVAGKIVCIGCTLEQREGGADAQCTLHAKHAQGLLLEDGTLWTFVDNARGHHAITNRKLLGRDVKVLGWKFPKAKYVELWKYQVKEGDAWVAYDFCKT
ncbi:MAG: hypothetical protein HYY17_00035 [Planctomycetes bacterium]|nr:hypothetical protein [Planctomycetota bacterium]